MDLLYQALQEKGQNLTLLYSTTADAIRILNKLDIDVRHKVELGKGELLLKYTGAIELGGNAVEDEGIIYDACSHERDCGISGRGRQLS